MADFIAIEEINNHIDNAVNMNNANTYAYEARTNANTCNQILSNIYYTNGDAKKSLHLHIINQNLNFLNTNPFQLTNIYLYGLSAASANGEWDLYINDTKIPGTGGVLSMRAGALELTGYRTNLQSMENAVKQGWTTSFKIPVANLYINSTGRTSLRDVNIIYSVYE